MQIFDEYSFVTWNWWANEYMYIYVGMNTISQQNTYCELKLSLAIFTPKLNVIYILNRWTMILKNSSCTVSDLSTLNNPCFSVHEVHCVSLRYFTICIILVKQSYTDYIVFNLGNYALLERFRVHTRISGLDSHNLWQLH